MSHTLAEADDDHSTPQQTAACASKCNLWVAEMVTVFHHNEMAGLDAASPLSVHESHHLPWRRGTERAKLHKHR